MDNFKCLKSNFSSLEKRINAICKKLDKHGLFHNFEIISESVELVPVFEIVENAGHLEQVQRPAQPMEIINYTFTMDTLKLGEYTPVAVLEHGATTDSKNIIHLLDTTITIPQAWATVSGKCEHCNSDRRRNKTVILMDVDGNYKQVGTTCIKDFTGIDGADVISVYADITGITTSNIVFISEQFPTSNYTNTVNYLAHCINMITAKGYQKDETKFKAYELSKKDSQITEKSKQKAIEIIDFFAQFENIEHMQKLLKSEASFYWNIATAVQNEYSKISGFIAYAPIAYDKAIQTIGKNQTAEVVKAISQHQFTIGDKIVIIAEYVHSFSYDTSYNGGYSTTTNFIHLFKDENGNIFKWSTSKCIDITTGDKINLMGTVKKHTEYQGEKQTELTRCKIK